MKCVVLSAGKGSRLRPVTSCVPKPLLPVGGGRLIDKVLSYLSVVCEEILVVSGHLNELLEGYLKRKHPHVKLVRADRIPSGNLYTLLRAEEFLKGSEFLIANADHVFPKEVWDFFPAKREGIQLACHRKGIRNILEDEMKVKVEGNKLLYVDKRLEDYEGAYVGLAYVGRDVQEVFWETAGRVFSLLKDTAKVEDVFGSLTEGRRPEVVWIDEVRFYEVDTMEDLRRAWSEAKAGAL